MYKECLKPLSVGEYGTTKKACKYRGKYLLTNDKKSVKYIMRRYISKKEKII